MGWIVICAILALAGCAGQSYKFTQKLSPDGKTVERNCEAGVHSWWSVTQAESLNAKISCDPKRVTEVGLTGVSTKVDTEAINAAASVLGAAAGSAAKAAVGVP